MCEVVEEMLWSIARFDMIHILMMIRTVLCVFSRTTQYGWCVNRIITLCGNFCNLEQLNWTNSGWGLFCIIMHAGFRVAAYCRSQPRDVQMKQLQRARKQLLRTNVSAERTCADFSHPVGVFESHTCNGMQRHYNRTHRR